MHRSKRDMLAACSKNIGFTNLLGMLRTKPGGFRSLLRRHGFEPKLSKYSNFFIYPLDRFPDLNERVAEVLEPLCSVPVLRWAASVYLVSARKK
jgi:hypothetical protein